MLNLECSDLRILAKNCYQGYMSLAPAEVMLLDVSQLGIITAKCNYLYNFILIRFFTIKLHPNNKAL